MPRQSEKRKEARLFAEEAKEMAKMQADDAAELAKAVAKRIAKQLVDIGVKPVNELTPEERKFLANQALKDKIPS